MRVRALLLVASAIAMALPAAATAAPDGPIQIKNMSSFAIAPANLPAGCPSVSKNYDTNVVTITCDSQDHYTAGFKLPPSMQAKCTNDGKYICNVSEN